MKSYLAVARANFLLLPVTLVAVGAAAAAYDGGAFDPGRTVIALIGLVALHASVNSFNEYSDFRRGIDLETERTPFSGGSGVLPDGRLSAGAALRVGFVGAAIGLAVGIYFLRVAGWRFLPILLLGALCVLAYTDFLARIYLGELAAGLGLGTLPVLGTALVQGGELGNAALAASIPPFFMTFNLLLLNEFPDEQADRRGGRRNLVTLMGRRGAAGVYVLMVSLMLISVIQSVRNGVLPIGCLLATLPSVALIGPVRWALRRFEQGVPLPALAANVVWNLATNSLMAGALAMAAR